MLSPGHSIQKSLQKLFIASDLEVRRLIDTVRRTVQHRCRDGTGPTSSIGIRDMKRFCVLTSGRAGSTALMDALSRFDDIAVPHKQIDCVDNEILHPRRRAQYAQQYQQLTGLPVSDELTLIHAFYESNRNAPYAGFKSMPERHRFLKEFAAQPNLQFITLRRGDVPSTVASFLMAFDAGTWRREGGEQPNRLVFGPSYEKRSIGHLRYLEQCEGQLHELSGAIHLQYEDLCQPDFRCPSLDEFFQRHIELINPKPSTTGASYVENWDEFCQFINQHRQGSTQSTTCHQGS
jgi:hypothetical protein